MKKISKEDIEKQTSFFIKEIENGKVFIYPTDTIYGIGCDATLSDSVQKIIDAKKREKKPMSVIAPSKDWIKENCILKKEFEKHLDKLPGPYTLVLKLKDKNAISKNVNSGLDTIGIRIPNNWFSQIIAQTGNPFITTSVNITGEPFVTDPDQIEESILEYIDYVIDDGTIFGSPSTLIDLSGDKEKIIKR